MKKRTRLLLALALPLFFFVFSPRISRAQVSIKGRVINSSNNEVVTGATVQLKGTQTGTITNASGEYTIRANPGDTLLFSSVGFITKQVEVPQGGDLLNIQLNSSSTELSNVVIVGYGTQQRKDVTGAISSISNKEFNPGTTIQPIQQIQGKVAGLVVTQPGGDPNGEPTIRLRGQASLTGGQTPLIVVDGVPLDDPNELSNIPPSDILSYNVLKDASAAAIYGSRGANGVIIITTKRGESGSTHVSYSGSIEVDRLAKEYDLLNANEFKKAIGSSASFYDKGGNTNWYKAITRTAVSHTHNLSISGGTPSFNFRVSGSYTNDQGVVINTGRKIVGINFNAEKRALNDKLDIKLNVINSQTNRKLVDNNIFTYATNAPPTYPVFNSDGTYFAWTDFDQMNPVARQMMEKNINTENFRLIAPTIDYNIISDLTIGVRASLLDDNVHTEFFQPQFPAVGNVNNGSRSYTDNQSQKADVHVNYVHQWGRSNFSAIGVFEYNDFITDEDGLSGQQFLNESLQDNALGNGNATFNQISSFKQEYKLASLLGRITYNYNSKYFLTASFRRDGSSKFGLNNRWGNFPSVSVAWRLSQEGFLQASKWINDLKINVGYGVTGNQDAITPYNTLLTLAGIGYYYDAGTWKQEYAPNQNQNQDLKWEERIGRNIGLDFSLFGNRLSGNMNVFNDKTKNLLFNYTVPVPPFYVPTILANVGDLTNKGVEIQLNGDLIKNKDFSWNAGGQLTFIRTRVTNLSGTYNGFKLSTNHIPVGYAIGRGYAQNAITFLQVGYTPNVFFLPHFIGVDSQGGQLFADGKGGKLNSNQLTPSTGQYIDPSPKFSYGLNNSFSYKNWSINFFLLGVYGGKVFNDTRSLIDNYTRLPGNNVTKEALTNGIREQQVASDLWLQNDSYLRLDNATISYNFRNITGLDNLELFISGNNLFVITKYKGLDPEVPVSRIDISYSSQGYYPMSRSLSIGANITFK